MRTAEEVRAILEEHGGLVSQSTLADRWNVTPAWIARLRTRDGFPSPVCKVGRIWLWLVSEVDEWKEAQA